MGCSGVKHTATGLQSSGDVFSGVTNHTSLSGNPMDESGFGGCKENGSLPDCIEPSVKFGGGGVMLRGWAWPLRNS